MLLLLPLVGAAVGYWAAPFLAAGHDTVRLAARVWREEAEALAERTEASDAFRVTGRPSAELLDEARAIERRFRVGATVLGAFLGLVAALQFAGFATRTRERIYLADPTACVACGRCFLACPREHVRLKELGATREV
jgi:NAD-dependent dihydropyrimidine dehydrogenase PreA subunit